MKHCDVIIIGAGQAGEPLYANQGRDYIGTGNACGTPRIGVRNPCHPSHNRISNPYSRGLKPLFTNRVRF